MKSTNTSMACISRNFAPSTSRVTSCGGWGGGRTSSVVASRIARFGTVVIGAFHAYNCSTHRPVSSRSESDETHSPASKYHKSRKGSRVFHTHLEIRMLVFFNLPREPLALSISHHRFGAFTRFVSIMSAPPRASRVRRVARRLERTRGRVDTAAAKGLRQLCSVDKVHAVDEKRLRDPLARSQVRRRNCSRSPQRLHRRPASSQNQLPHAPQSQEKARQRPISGCRNISCISPDVVDRGTRC